MKVWVHKTPDTIEVQISAGQEYSPDVLLDMVNRALMLLGTGIEYQHTDLDPDQP